jgi:hypothetical protein
MNPFFVFPKNTIRKYKLNILEEEKSYSSSNNLSSCRSSAMTAGT